MAENSENSEDLGLKIEAVKNASGINQSDEKVIQKESIPYFIPTYRINRRLYPIPIVIVVVIAGILAYLTYILVGVQYDAGYFSESEFGAIGGILNGVIYTAIAAFTAFIIIFLIKRKGIGILMYIFGIGFGLIAFFQTWFFGEIILLLIFYNNVNLFYLFDFELIYFTLVFTIFIIYRYFTSKSINTKNFIVLYIGLLIGASMGVIMPLWTTLAILIGISCWDIFAVFYKHGPIKQLIDIASQSNEKEVLSGEEIKAKIKSGEYTYDTSKLEIGIGDLAFYSMLTSSALVQTNNIFVMIFTSIAIIIGTGITITGLKRNKILPGLPISIFLGLGTMLLSGYLLSV